MEFIDLAIAIIIFGCILNFVAIFCATKQKDQFEAIPPDESLSDMDQILKEVEAPGPVGRCEVCHNDAKDPDFCERCEIVKTHYLKIIAFFVCFALFSSCTTQRWHYSPGANDKSTTGRISQVYQTKAKGRVFTWAKVGYLHILVDPSDLDSTISTHYLKEFKGLKRLGEK